MPKLKPFVPFSISGKPCLTEVPASVQLIDLAVWWGDKARAHWCAGQRDSAVVAARKAIIAYDLYGAREVTCPQVVTACRRIVDEFEI